MRQAILFVIDYIGDVTAPSCLLWGWRNSALLGSTNFTWCWRVSTI